MTHSDLSAFTIVWEERVERELCIDLPIIGRKRVALRACVRAVREDRFFIIEMEAFGKRWRYPVEDARHTPVQWGIGQLELSIKSIKGGVQIVLEGCLSLNGTRQSSLLLGKEVRFVRLRDLTEGELMILGFADPAINGFNMRTRDEVGAISCELPPVEAKALADRDTG